MLKKLLYLLTITCLILTLACNALEDMKDDKDEISKKTKTVIFTISIPTGINSTYCDFNFSSSLDNAIYTLDNGIVGDEVNTAYIPGVDFYTNEWNTDLGYYVHLINSTRIYIQKNPTNTGIFDSDDELIWTLTLNNVPSSSKIISVSATNGATVSYTIE